VPVRAVMEVVGERDISEHALKFGASGQNKREVR
jgi:hypothetical protein